MLVGRMARGGFKEAGKVEGADAAAVGHLLQAERAGEALAHELDGAQHGDGRRELGRAEAWHGSELAQQGDANGTGQPFRDDGAAGGGLQLVLELLHEDRSDVRGGQFAKAQGGVEGDGGAELRRDGFQKPRLQTEDQDAHFARPAKADGVSGGGETQLSAAVRKLARFAIEQDFAPEGLEEAVEQMLSRPAGVAHLTRRAAPLLQEEAGPAAGATHGGDRRRRVLLHIDGRKADAAHREDGGAGRGEWLKDPPAARGENGGSGSVVISTRAPTPTVSKRCMISCERMRTQPKLAGCPIFHSSAVPWM